MNEFWQDFQHNTYIVQKSADQALEILKVGVNQPSFKQDTDIKKIFKLNKKYIYMDIQTGV